MNKGVQKFDLISNDNLTQSLLNKLKEQTKQYSKLLSALEILGNFKGTTEVFINDIVEEEDYSYIKLWCFDQMDNIFAFFVQSTNKKDLNIIEKHFNNEICIFDLSLSKKFKLTSDNISLLRNSIENNFKYGRIITDKQTFCSIFLGDNISYQVLIDNEESEKIIDLKQIVSLLNSMQSIPTFMNFIGLFDNLIKNKSLNLKFIAFKDFNKIGEVTFSKEKEDSLKKIKV